MRMSMREGSSRYDESGREKQLIQPALTVNPDRVTLREFCSLCLAEYSVQLPIMLVTIAGLLTAFLVLLLWLR